MSWNPKNQYTRVCFTINLEAGKTWDTLSLDKVVRALRPIGLIAGKETAPSTGQKHWQGFFVLEKKMLAAKIMKVFAVDFKGTHFEAARGKNPQAWDYCKKEDPAPYVFGECPPDGPGQGARTDLDALYEMAKGGATDKEMYEADFRRMAQYGKSLRHVRELFASRRTEPSKLIFIWGETGFGKTSQAMKLSPEIIQYRFPFFIGYTGTNETVLFDDFDFATVKLNQMLRIVDRYPYTAEIKGETKVFAPKTIIFTSNDDPTLWFDKDPQHSAWLRRVSEFGEIMHLGEKVSVTQNLLSKYFKASPSTGGACAASGSSMVPGAAGPSESPKRNYEGKGKEKAEKQYDSTDTEDGSSSDCEHSQPSDYEFQHKLKRARTLGH